MLFAAGDVITFALEKMKFPFGPPEYFEYSIVVSVDTFMVIGLP